MQIRKKSSNSNKHNMSIGAYSKLRNKSSIMEHFMYDDFAAYEEERREIEFMENEAMVITGDFPVDRSEEDGGFTPSPLLNNPEIE